MAKSQAYTTFGSQLQQGDGATPFEAFASIAELKTLTPGETTVGTQDVTSHDSPVNDEGVPCEEFIPISVNEGEASAAGNWLATAGQLAVRTAMLFLGGAAGNWQITYGDFGKRLVTFTVAGSTFTTAANHGLTTGQAVQVASAGTLPAGLLARRRYFARRLGSKSLQLHVTNADALANASPITPGTAGLGTHSLRVSSRLSFTGLVVAHATQAPLDGAGAFTFKVKTTGPAVLA